MRGDDFDGDGYGDLLWRRDDGLIAVWRGTAAGLRQDIGFSQLVAADWWVAGKGDFDGDGRSDILWRKADGQVTVWSSTGSRFDATFNQIVDTRWQIATTGDFDGDGRDDIFWRRDDGLTTVWRATGTGFVDVGGSPPLPADFARRWAATMTVTGATTSGGSWMATVPCGSPPAPTSSRLSAFSYIPRETSPATSMATGSTTSCRVRSVRPLT